MALRTGHGKGAGAPRIEVLPVDELPAGVSAGIGYQLVIPDVERQRLEAVDRRKTPPNNVRITGPC
jgi:hypothetical protein